MKDVVKIWKLTVLEFEDPAFEFGGSLTEFKVPYSMTQRFRKLDANNESVFDKERAFASLAFTYANAIVAQFEILRQVSFKAFPPEDKEMLRKIVYLAVTYCVQNNEPWERINSSVINVPNFNFQSSSVNWLLSVSMIGKKAHHLLVNMGLDQYELYEKDAFYKTTPVGMVQIISKVDDKLDIDNITEQDAIDYLVSIGYTVTK